MIQYIELAILLKHRFVYMVSYFPNQSAY